MLRIVDCEAFEEKHFNAEEHSLVKILEEIALLEKEHVKGDHTYKVTFTVNPLYYLLRCYTCEMDIKLDI